MLRLSDVGSKELMLGIVSPEVSTRAYNEMRKCMEELTGIKFEVDVGDHKKVKPEDVVMEFSRNNVVAALYSRIDNELGRVIHKVILMDINSAEVVGTILLSKAGLDISDESMEDALREFANIIIGAYAAVLSRFFNSRFEYSIPEVVVDYDTAIVTDLVLPIAEVSQEIVMHNVKIRSDEGSISMEVLTMMS